MRGDGSVIQARSIPVDNIPISRVILAENSLRYVTYSDTMWTRMSFPHSGALGAGLRAGDTPTRSEKI